MTTCQCCGQKIAGESADAIFVDDQLMACCNRAYQEAECRGAREVELAHFAYALAASADMQGALARFAIAPSRLSLEAVRRMDVGRMRAGRTQPRTSAELRTVLARAMAEAERRGRSTIDAHDMLYALLYASHDLNGARLFASCRTRAGQERDGEPRQDFRARPAAYGEREHFGAAEVQRDGWWPARSGVVSAGVSGAERSVERSASDRRVVAAGGSRQQAAGNGGSESAQVGAPDQTPAVPATAAAAIGAGVVLELQERLQRQETLLAELIEKLEKITQAGGAVERSRVPRPARVARTAAVSNGRDGESETADAASATRDGDERGSEPPAKAAAQVSPRTGATLPPAQPVASLLPRTLGKRLSQRLKRRSLRPRKSRKFEPRIVAIAPGDGTRLRMLSTQSIQPARDYGAGEFDEETIDEALVDDDADNDGEGESPGNGPRQKRFYLAVDDDIVHAPSIGPRTTARLMRLGINKVRDLLACDPLDVAERIGARHVTPQRIAAWQRQARLVCTIPWLRGTHAQLLVGAGFDTVAAILNAERDALCVSILKFSATRNGQSVLRSGPPPEIEKIVRWVEYAAHAEVERAA